MINWKDRITTLVLVKQELMKQDVEQIWPHHFPEIGASEEYFLAIVNYNREEILALKNYIQ